MFSIDFSSKTQIIGWISEDMRDNTYLRNDKGTISYIKEEDVVSREDVFKTIGVKAVGFQILLLDRFNDVSSDIELVINDEVVWKFSEYISNIPNSSFLSKCQFEKGSRRVFVVYQKGDELHKLTSSLLLWNQRYFAKNLHSGISYSFCSVEEYIAQKDNVSKSDNVIYIMSRSIIKNMLIRCPDVGHQLIFPFLKSDWERLDFHGIGSVISCLGGFEKNVPFNNRKLLLTLITISTYPSLFFDKYKSGNFCYLSGELTKIKPISNDIVDKIKEFNNYPVVIVVSREIRKISDIKLDNCVVLMNLNFINRMYDLSDLPLDIMMKKIYKRGLKVRMLVDDSFSF